MLDGLNERTGRTPLHSLEVEACKSQADVSAKVNAIIESGVDVNACDNQRMTPLHIASDPRVCLALIQAGANVSARNIFGETPLHILAHTDFIESVTLLLTYKADIYATDKFSTNTPLHTAASQSKSKMVELLLSEGVDHHLRNRYEQTAVQTTADLAIHAVFQKHRNKCKIL